MSKKNKVWTRILMGSKWKPPKKSAFDAVILKWREDHKHYKSQSRAGLFGDEPRDNGTN